MWQQRYTGLINQTWRLIWNNNKKNQLVILSYMSYMKYCSAVRCRVLQRETSICRLVLLYKYKKINLQNIAVNANFHATQYSKHLICNIPLIDHCGSIINHPSLHWYLCHTYNRAWSESLINTEVWLIWMPAGLDGSDTEIVERYKTSESEHYWPL